MKSKLLLLMTLVLIAVFPACRKKIKGEDAKYIGTWTSYYSTLKITKDGSGSFVSTSDGVNFSISGKAKIKNKTITISAYIAKKKLGITREPSEEPITGITYMTLDGEDYAKAD